MTLEERDAKILVLNTTFLVRVRELLAGFPPAFGDCKAVGEAIEKYEEEYKAATYCIEHEYAASAIQ
jgi:hypothetical protein